jgi:hypothetical protein
VAPFAIDGLAGVTAMDSSVTELDVTASVVLPDIAPRAALMTDVPVPTALAKPPEVMVATLVVAELHVTVPVIFCVALSL